MNILKCFKNNTFGGQSDFQLSIKDNNKVYINHVIDRNQGNTDAETKVDLFKYLFDHSSILSVISNELNSDPVYVGSVLKHKDQKTFKYIVRNILSLQYLKIQDNLLVEFREASETLDNVFINFFKRMLLDNHTIKKHKKIYR